jgi:hypothetical protein
MMSESHTKAWFAIDPSIEATHNDIRDATLSHDVKSPSGRLIKRFSARIGTQAVSSRGCGDIRGSIPPSQAHSSYHCECLGPGQRAFYKSLVT